jgi:hypothetical protein
LVCLVIGPARLAALAERKIMNAQNVNKLKDALRKVPDSLHEGACDLFHALEAHGYMDLETVTVDNLWTAITDLLVERTGI